MTSPCYHLSWLLQLGRLIVMSELLLQQPLAQLFFVAVWASAAQLLLGHEG